MTRFTTFNLGVGSSLNTNPSVFNNSNTISKIEGSLDNVFSPDIVKHLKDVDGWVITQIKSTTTFKTLGELKTLIFNLDEFRIKFLKEADLVSTVDNGVIPNGVFLVKLTNNGESLTFYEISSSDIGADQTARIESLESDSHKEVTLSSLSDPALEINGQELTLTLPAAFVPQLLDEDNFSSNSETQAPTQQSTKAYVDNANVWTFVDTNSINVTKNSKLAIVNLTTLNLPDNPEDGLEVIVINAGQDWDNVNTNVVSTGTINNDQASFLIDHNLPYGHLIFIFNKLNNNWHLIVNSIGDEVIQQSSFDASSTIETADNTNITVDQT